MTLLHTLERGTGPRVVVLLHSGGMSSRQWRGLMDVLSPTFRVIAVDFLGSGRSPPWRDGTPFELATEVDAVLESVPTDAPVHFVGHSYGASIALQIAARRPDLVASLALYEPVVLGLVREAGDEDALAELRTLDATLTSEGDAAGGTEPWLRGFVDYWSGRGAWDSLPPPSRAGFLAAGAKVFCEVRALLGDRTPSAHYRRLTMPTLLMSGARSPIAERRAMQRLAEAMPSAIVRVFEAAGHMGPLTHMTAVNEAIAAHLEASRSE